MPTPPRTQEDTPLFSQGDLVVVFPLSQYTTYVVGFLDVYRDPKKDVRNLGKQWSYQLYRHEVGKGQSIWIDESNLKLAEPS